MKKLVAAAALTLVVPVASAKVLISIDAGAGYNLSTLGDESSFMDGTFDLAGDSTVAPTYGLGMEAKNGLYGWAKLSLPVLPDIKLKYESMVLEGTNTVTFSETIIGETFSVVGAVDSELDLSHVDMTVTFGLPIPVIDFDFGLTARALMGGFSATGDINGSTQTKEVLFPSGSIIPMGYLSVAATVPGVGVKIGGEINTLPIGDSKVSDWNVKGTWFAPLPTNMLVKLGVEAGYRSFNFTIADSTVGIDTSDFASDVKVSGFFIGGTAHF